MIIKESAENYLETILVLSKKLPVVRSVDIATELGFKKSSVSVAMKNLRENGYIDVMGDGSIVLLDEGKAIAEKLFAEVTLTGPSKSRNSHKFSIECLFESAEEEGK